MAELDTQQLLESAIDHHQAGRLGEAQSRCKQILLRDPKDADALQLLGVVTLQLGDKPAALEMLQRAAAMNPDAPDCHCSLGMALSALDRNEEAEAQFRKALSLKSDYVEAGIGLGGALRALGRRQEAEEIYRQIARRQPALASQFLSLGNRLRSQGRWDEAIAAFHRALALHPQDFKAHNNLADALLASGRLDEAVAAVRQAMALRPDSGEIHANLGNMLKDVGLLDESVQHLRQAVALLTTNAVVHSNLVMTLHYRHGEDAAAILAEQQRWNDLHAKPLSPLIQEHRNDRSPDRRLKIGYVSPDFRNHVVGRNLLPLLREHDHGPFEIFCYSNVARGDAFTEQFRSHADHWRDITQVGDEHAARMIRQDGIDLLIDLAGHTAFNRLLVFARKPAPIQATFGGYPGGTGLATMDWRISDPYLDPPGLSETHYVEKIIRLPHSFWCYDPAAMQVQAMGVGPLPALANGCMTFGCLNNFCKISDPTLALWSRVLKRVANSRLLVMAPPGSARQRLLQTMADLGIDAQRIAFVQHQLRQEYLQVYHRIDLGLDTYPYNGHTTSLDSLWMGVPVITLVGERSVGRAGYSQLCNLNLADLAAKDEDEFVKIAAQLAGDLPRLAQLRSSLQERMRRSALTDAAGFARGIQAAYRQMWHAWCAGSCAGS